MIKTCISKDWLFSDFENGYKSIDLPHDYSITAQRRSDAAGGAANGFFGDGHGKYIKYIKPSEEKKHYILDIDGAYMCAEININNQCIAMHPHGYTPFLADLTDNIRFGRTNKISIITNALQPSTRWYSGAGLYRDVFLWEGGDVRIEPWDIFVTVKYADENSAEINIEYTVSADKNADITISSDVLNADGKSAVRTETKAAVIKNEKTKVLISLKIENPCLWDTQNPYLYSLHTEVSYDNTVCDTSDTSFGIRTIYADAEKGFLLNGKPMKLRGGCIHHDHGVLGAAAFPAAEERKITLLKKVGFNAIRTSHYPPSLALLEICDKLGIIVMDEAFDMWNKGKNAVDYHLWFSDWWARDISYMVLRDRNHPCVISYSIGNEIPERDGNSDGAAWSRKLSDEIRKYDKTRFVTSGICGMWALSDVEDMDPDDYKQDSYEGYSDIGEGTVESSWPQRTEAYAAPLDIVGYNYMYFRYEFDHKLYPNRVMWGSETHALKFYDSWNETMKNNYVIGDFTWTAYDNLGEAGTGRSLWARDGVINGISLAQYPWRTCYQGDLDLCGYRRPQSYFREAVWLGNTEPKIFVTHPEHFGEGFSGTGWHWYDVSESWTFDDKYIGRPIKAEAYTDADKIIWFINGRQIGESIPEKAIAAVNTVYEKGTITAVAYKNGKEYGRSCLTTTDKASAISVVPEKTEFYADNRDLCYFEIFITDKDNNRVADAANEIHCIAEGGELLGIFSGDPKNEDEYTLNTCHAFEGRALAIMRTTAPGQVSLTVFSDELAPGHAQATAKLPD